MKAYIAALAAALVISSPALAANKCPAGKNTLLQVLNKLHKQAPDSQAHTITDKDKVAKAAKVINDIPPVSHDPADEIVVVVSQARHAGVVLMVSHGCVLQGASMMQFLQQMQQDNQGA